MFFLRNWGLDLPVYTEWTPVAWTQDEIVAAAARDSPSFIRRTRLEYSGPGNLKKALAIADTAMAYLSDQVGTDYVVPAWGLYRGQSPYNFTDSSAHHLIPKGYCLVADVRTVRDALPLDEIEQSELHRRLGQFYNDAVGYVLMDYGPWQYVKRNEEDGSITTTLVDIEPRLYNTSSR